MMMLQDTTRNEDPAKPIAEPSPEPADAIFGGSGSEDTPLRIRILFEVAGVRQYEVADHLGVSTALLSLMLNGKRPFPDDRKKALVGFVTGHIVDRLAASDGQ